MTATLDDWSVALHDGRIAEDLSCVCGYNLRTLEYAGQCPECGGLIEQAERMYRRDQIELRSVGKVSRLITRIYLVVWFYCAGLYFGDMVGPSGLRGLIILGAALGVIGLGVTGFIAIYHLLLVVITFNQKHTKEAWQLAWRLPLCPLLALVVLIIAAMLY